MQFFESEAEAAVRAVDAKEDHGNVLRGPGGDRLRCGGAIVRVALVWKKRVIIAAGELLSLQNPAVKNLQEKHERKSVCMT